MKIFMKSINLIFIIMYVMLIPLYFMSHNSVSKPFINENDLLEVTRHTSGINEEKK